MTTSDKQVDLAIETQIRFTRLANKYVKEHKHDFDLVDKQLRDFLVTIEYPVTFASVTKKIESILEPYHAKLSKSLVEMQDEIALYAATLEVKALKGAKQVIEPTEAHVIETLRKQMFQGVTMTQMVEEFIRNDKQRVVRAVNIGLTYGRTAMTITKSVRSSIRSKGEGVRNIARRGLELLIRSAIQYSVSAGRDTVWNTNPDLVKRLVWISVLDSKTSDICTHYDGKTFARGEGPRPPAHINCRSTIIPLLPGQKLPGRQTWFEWIEKQPQYIQKEALGVTRFNLWKQAGVAPQKFLDASGEQYTLHELKELMPKAFERLST